MISLHRTRTSRDTMRQEWDDLKKAKEVYRTMCLAFRQATGEWAKHNVVTSVRYDTRKEYVGIRDRLRRITGSVDLAGAMTTLRYGIEKRKDNFRPSDYRPVDRRESWVRQGFINEVLEEYPKERGDITATHEWQNESLSGQKATICVSRLWHKKILAAAIVTSSAASKGHPNITTHASQIMSPMLNEYGFVGYEAKTIRMNTRIKRFVREDGFIILRTKTITTEKGGVEATTIFDPAFGTTFDLAMNRAKKRLFQHIAEKIGD